MKTIIVNPLNGDSAEMVGRAWWLEVACELADGRVAVARCDADSLTVRKSGIVGDYTSSPDYKGQPVRYMIALTDDDLVQYGIFPGKLVFPHVIDAARPKTNRAESAVSVRRQQQQMNWLQNDCIGTPAQY